MTFDEFTKLLTEGRLFRFEDALARRLLPVFYVLGLAGIGLWALTHLFASFAEGFGQGLWGLLEIAVFGLLMVVALRIACEALQHYFERAADAEPRRERERVAAKSILADVQDAIRDLGSDEREPPVDPYLDYSEGDDDFRDEPGPDEDPVENDLPRPKLVRRTAKRMPRERL